MTIRLKLDKEHCCEHAPTVAGKSYESELTVLRNQQMKNDRTIPNNKPDIIISDNVKGTCLIIDRHFRRQKCDQERSRKILKYKDIGKCC
jgi:hypothetical protein